MLRMLVHSFTLLAEIEIAALDALVPEPNNRRQSTAVTLNMIVDGEIAWIIRWGNWSAGGGSFLLDGIGLLHRGSKGSYLNMHIRLALGQENFVVILVDNFNFIIVGIWKGKPKWK